MRFSIQRNKPASPGLYSHFHRLFGKIGTYVIDKKYSYDIDEEIDFKINEIVKKNN